MSFSVLCHFLIHLIGGFSSAESETCCSSEEEEEKEEGEEELGDDEKFVVGSLSPEELEKLKEAVDERKKLITTLRGKPWPMRKKLPTLR